MPRTYLHVHVALIFYICFGRQCPKMEKKDNSLSHCMLTQDRWPVARISSAVIWQQRMEVFGAQPATWEQNVGRVEVKDSAHQLVSMQSAGILIYPTLKTVHDR